MFAPRVSTTCLPGGFFLLRGCGGHLARQGLGWPRPSSTGLGWQSPSSKELGWPSPSSKGFRLPHPSSSGLGWPLPSSRGLGLSLDGLEWPLLSLSLWTGWSAHLSPSLSLSRNWDAHLSLLSGVGVITLLVKGAWMATSFCKGAGFVNILGADTLLTPSDQTLC